MTTLDLTSKNEYKAQIGRSTESQHGKSKDMAGNKTGQREDTVPVEFNLSDPEQLAQQLEKVDLTEDESDELLREAYKVNKQLRMMLKQKQDNIATSLRSQSANSGIGKKSVLPPIKSKAVAGVAQRSLKAYGQESPKNASSSSSMSKSNPKSAKSKSTVQRPTWDDRFSYS